MTDTPDHWGFHEVGPLADARTGVLKAIKRANLADYRAAWCHYQELAEAQIEVLPDVRKWAAIRAIPAKLRIARAMVKKIGLGHILMVWRSYRAMVERIPEDNPHAKAQIGLIVAKAGIWRTGRDRVRYWEELHDAATYARGMGYGFTSAALERAARSSSFYAEFLEATRRYDEAIDEYIEREQDECLTGRERGLVNLRLAECYQALLEERPPSEPTDLRDLLGTTIESALEYLGDQPEYVYALRLLEEFEGDA